MGASRWEGFWDLAERKTPGQAELEKPSSMGQCGMTGGGQPARNPPAGAPAGAAAAQEGPTAFPINQRQAGTE